MKSNEQYVSLYDYRGKASRESGLGQKVYESAKEKGIHVIYQDLPPDVSRPEYNRVATYPKAFLDEYFGRPVQLSLNEISQRLIALETQFEELIKKLEINVTNSDDDDTLPF